MNDESTGPSHLRDAAEYYSELERGIAKNIKIAGKIPQIVDAMARQFNQREPKEDKKHMRACAFGEHHELHAEGLHFLGLALARFCQAHEVGVRECVDAGIPLPTPRGGGGGR